MNGRELPVPDRSLNSWEAADRLFNYILEKTENAEHEPSLREGHRR